MAENKRETVKQFRDRMTNLFRRRSVIALCAGALTVVLAFYGIVAGIENMIRSTGKSGFSSYIYFTMISNTFAALAAAFTVPFAVEGVRRSRFTLPGWVAAAYYIAAVSLAVVMIFTACVISWASPGDAYAGANIVTHLICPALILILFFQIENGRLFTLRDQLLGMLPFGVYTVVYYVKAVLIGEENGGWPDIYKVRDFPLYRLFIPAGLILGFAVSLAIRLLSNRLTRARRRRTFACFADDADPVEARIEAYGLGVMTGAAAERHRVEIPCDILEYYAQRFCVPPQAVAAAFSRGLMNGMKEKEAKTSGKRKSL